MGYIVREADPRVLDAICRTDFASFARRCFHTVHPADQFQMSWHIRALAHVLEQVRRGKITRLIINLPPGTLKSFIASVAWPAFVLGHEPHKRIASISYGAELTVDFGNRFRQIVNSAQYQALFPLMQTSSMKDTETEVRTTQNGFRLGTTVEGALTGLHADVIVIDDPIKPMDASSDAKRERVNTWFNRTLLSRLNDPRTGAIIVVMQRVHEDDLTGMLLRTSDQWTVLNLPAIAETEEWVSISDHQRHLRHVGDALHPERETAEELRQLRSQVGPETFAAQWQQCPTPATGTIIRREWLRYYDQLPPITSASTVIQAWDLAAKVGDRNDWSVVTTWLYHDSKYYLMNEFRERMQYAYLSEYAIRYAHSWRASIVLFEDDILGNALATTLKSAGLPSALMPLNRSKEMRAQIQSTKFRDGRVLFQRGAPSVPEIEAELLAFPKGRFDDRVDSICLALSYEPPEYNLTTIAKGMEQVVTNLWWQQQFLSRL